MQHNVPPPLPLTGGGGVQGKEFGEEWLSGGGGDAVACSVRERNQKMPQRKVPSTH